MWASNIRIAVRVFKTHQKTLWKVLRICQAGYVVTSSCIFLLFCFIARREVPVRGKSTLRSTGINVLSRRSAFSVFCFTSPYYGAVKRSLKTHRFASYGESWMHPKRKCRLWQLSWLPMWVQLGGQTLTGSAVNAPATTPVFPNDRKVSCVKCSLYITHVFKKNNCMRVRPFQK